MSLPPTCPPTSSSVALKPGNFSPSCTSQPLEQGASAPANTEEAQKPRPKHRLSPPDPSISTMKPVKHIETKQKVSSCIQMEELHHEKQKKINEMYPITSKLGGQSLLCYLVFCSISPSLSLKTSAFNFLNPLAYVSCKKMIVIKFNGLDLCKNFNTMTCKHTLKPSQCDSE